MASMVTLAVLIFALVSDQRTGESTHGGTDQSTFTSTTGLITDERSGTGSNGSSGPSPLLSGRAPDGGKRSRHDSNYKKR